MRCSPMQLGAALPRSWPGVHSHRALFDRSQVIIDVIGT